MKIAKTAQTEAKLRHELDLIGRFVDCYQKQLDGVIRQLNVSPGRTSEGQSIRVCIEAVNMMLSTHGQLAGAVKHLSLPAGELKTCPASVPAPPTLAEPVVHSAPCRATLRGRRIRQVRVPAADSLTGTGKPAAGKRPICRSRCRPR